MMGREPLTRGAQIAVYVEKLRAWGELDRVLPRVDSATRALMEHPPAASEWLPLRHNVDLFVAVDAILGPGRARALAYEAARDGLTVHLRPIVGLALAAFGASPATLFAHAETFLRFSIRGQKLTYESWNATSGALEIRVLGLQPPLPFFEAWAGIAAHAIELCGTPAAVSVAHIEPRSEDQVGTLHVAWARSR